MRFRYGRDWVCLVACGLYLLNRFWLKPRIGHGIIHDQFNDLLLIPAGLPWVLWLQRTLRFRTHDGIPTGGEIALHLIVWSVICEWIGPTYFRMGTGDWRDCVAYALGAAAVWVIWSLQGRRELARI